MITVHVQFHWKSESSPLFRQYYRYCSIVTLLSHFQLQTPGSLSALAKVHYDRLTVSLIEWRCSRTISRCLRCSSINQYMLQQNPTHCKWTCPSAFKMMLGHHEVQRARLNWNRPQAVRKVISCLDLEWGEPANCPCRDLSWLDIWPSPGAQSGHQSKG